MNVFGYCRVSTSIQVEEGYSLDEQKSRIEAYCKGMGWNLLKVYVDAGESGAKADRPALQEMIRNIKMVDKVVVYKLDRLSRSQKDTLYLIEDVFLKNNVEFVSMTENLDTSSPFGKAMIGILAVFAQLEREQIRDRMMMGKDARAKEGRVAYSYRTPIGYKYINGELLVDDDADQVREVYNLCLRGKSFGEIANTMIAAGLSHRLGDWERTTVRQVLTNPVYTGRFRYRGNVYEGHHQPIIDDETFNQASKIAIDRTERYSFQHHPGHATSYLAGFLVCAKCGGMLYKRAEANHTPVYVCKNHANPSQTGKRCNSKRWKLPLLDKMVLDEVRSLTIDDLPPAPKVERNKDSELKKIDKQLSRLIDLYSVGQFDLETLKEKTDKLTARRKTLSQTEERTDFAKVVRSLGDIIDRGEVSEVRLVLSQLIDHIDVYEEDVSIHWLF